MADVQQAPAQHKQPSRKGKKAWRKNVDITEVQTGLEDVREEIVAGGILSERPSDELFAVDTTGSQTIKHDYSKKNKPLKADEIIAQRSVIPAVDTRKRKIGDGIVQGSSKRRANGTYVPHKELQRLKDLAFTGEGFKKTIITEKVDHDPWAMEPVAQDPRFSFIPEKKAKVEPTTLKHAPISLAENGRPFAAVRKPDAGKSYNPDFEAWEDLVKREGEKAVEAETARLAEEQAEAERMEKALAEAAKPDPVTDDEYESAWESEWEGIQSGAEDSYVNKKRPERKTPSERNKIKRRKAAERQEKWEKQMKKKEEQQQRIREIAKEVARKEAERKANGITDEADGEDSGEEEVLRRRALGGKLRVPEAPLEVVLADELQDSLRALRPEGNLLKDRYRNMLLNGKIEARKSMQHKKPMRSVTEKWTYKDWKLK